MKEIADFEKLQSLGVDYLSEYFAVFIATLRRPTTNYQPVLPNLAGATPVRPVFGPSKHSYEPRLNPGLWRFVLINIFIGTTINLLLKTNKITLVTIPSSPSEPTTILKRS